MVVKIGLAAMVVVLIGCGEEADVVTNCYETSYGTRCETYYNEYDATIDCDEVGEDCISKGFNAFEIEQEFDEEGATIYVDEKEVTIIYENGDATTVEIREK